MVAAIEERKANTPEGAAKRAALVKAMELKNYEFNAHGVELGQFYTSTAIVSDGTTRPEPTRDPDLYYEASTVPGSHLPHAWVGDNKVRLAMMDLAPYDRFTLISGIAGEAWEDAADKVALELGVPVRGCHHRPRPRGHRPLLRLVEAARGRGERRAAGATRQAHRVALAHPADRP